MREAGFVVVPDKQLQHAFVHDRGAQGVHHAAVGVARIVDGHQRLFGNAKTALHGGHRGLEHAVDFFFAGVAFQFINHIHHGDHRRGHAHGNAVHFAL